MRDNRLVMQITVENGALKRLIEVLIKVATQYNCDIVGQMYMLNSVPIPFVLCDGS